MFDKVKIAKSYLEKIIAKAAIEHNAPNKSKVKIVIMGSGFAEVYDGDKKLEFGNLEDLLAKYIDQ